MFRVSSGLVSFSVLLILVTGCATTVKPIVDHDPNADFVQYGSFAFISNHPMIPSETSGPVSPLTEERIMNSISRDLKDRGFTLESDGEEANFAISFTLGPRDKMQIDTYPEPYRAGYENWGWGGGYYGYAPGYGEQVDVSAYTEDALSIDVYDVSEHRPIWHGVAAKELTDTDLQDPGPVVDEIVTAILSGFPPDKAPKKVRPRSSPWATRY